MLSNPPQDFVQPCSRPVKLPDRALTQVEVELNWTQDRGRLVTCAERHRAVVDFYQDRDSRIMAQ